MKKKFKTNSLIKSLLGMAAIVLFSFQSGFPQSARPNRLSYFINDLKQTESFKQFSPFSQDNNEQLKQFTTQGVALKLDQNKLSQLMLEKNKSITLSLSYLNGQVFELELAQAEILSPGFKLGTKGTNPTDNLNYTPGLYYRGIIKGDNQSIASVSFFDNEIMGVFSDNSGNYVIGQVKGNPGHYVLYNDKYVINKPTIECATTFVAPNDQEAGKNGGGNGITAVNCKVVKCYYECDFAMYQDFSSNTTTTSNYLTSIFNNEATLYLNDGVTIQISQILVWTSLDPEAAFTSTSSVNGEFITQTGSTFNGDMAQFLTTRNLGGGIAQGFSGLCNKSQAHSTAQIYTTYSNVPTYSWTVEVMTHEMGHLLGSRHTHACVWNGNNTAIDGCSGGVEGGCALPGNPAGGGTIMSYCHLVAVGINFNLGFGPQPAALVLGNVNAAACLTGSSAATPTGLTTTNITNNSATLNWNAVIGATQYTVEYKLTSAGSYTSLGNFVTTTANLPGLVALSPYTWRVQADCSPFATATFTTTVNPGCGVPTNLTTTSIKSTTAKVNWSAFTGAASYTVKYKVYGTSTFKYTTAANAFKNLSNLLPATKYVWAVKTTCSNGSTTAYTTTKTFTTQSLVAPNNYCTSNGTSSTLEDITNVTLGSINNSTGDNGGYGNFTAQSTNLTAGSANSVSVSIFKSASGDLEYVTVWIDYNRDGDFTDANEVAFSGNGTQTTFSGTINVPASPNIGSARMRVTVKYASAPSPCGTYDYGETEDYLVNLTAGPVNAQNYRFTDSDLSSIDFSVFPNPAQENISLKINNANNDYFELSILSLTGQEVKAIRLQGENNAVNISDLKNGFYQLKLTDKQGHVAMKKFIKN